MALNIYGIQKLTLLDFPSKVACTLFTYGCNFRCPFCHNKSLVTDKCDEPIAYQEIIDFLNSRKKMLDGICLTG
nr:4Fe-4S cluster-binding domain-containing protein [Clostridia bacterium]